MKVLLLGATGYLGGNIAQCLLRDGHDVVCAVRATSDTSRIEPLTKQIISGGLEEIERFLCFNKIDWVINAVCAYKSNISSLYEEMLVSNMVYPLTVLNLAIKYGVGSFMTIGTSLPLRFNHYSFSKGMFAEFGAFLSEKDGIDFIDLRVEMFYGGFYEPDNRFIKSCIVRLLKDQDIMLTNGTQKRDIIRVEDVTGIISALISSEYSKGYKSLSVGSGESHSIRDIIEYLKETVLSHSNLRFGAVPTRNGEPDTLADIRWYDEIGYKMKYGFFDGLEDICSKYRSGLLK